MNAMFIFKKWNEMCSVETCDNCPMSSTNNGYDLACSAFKTKYPEEAVKKLLEYYHGKMPEQTRREDFLEMHPDAVMIGDTPAACCKDLGYCTDCCNSCKECWNEPVKRLEG